MRGAPRDDIEIYSPTPSWRLGEDWNCTHFALGDLDGDNLPDIVAVGELQPILVYMNKYDVTFERRWISTFGDQENSAFVALGPVLTGGIGAHRLDAVVGVRNTGASMVLEGSGSRTGEFTLSSRIGSDILNVSPGGGLQLADINGDGWRDVVLTNDVATGGSILVYLNRGGGHFDLKQTFPVGLSHPSGIALRDLNADGFPDLFVANLNGLNKVYLNDKSGQFAETGQTLGTLGESCTNVAVGDFNNDSIPDVFLTYLAQPNQVFFGTGQGRFSIPGLVVGTDARRSVSVALGDINRDGHLDAIVGNQGLPSDVYLNDGTGNFSKVGEIGPGTITTHVAMAYLQSDSCFPDVVMSNNNGAPIFVFYNQLGCGFNSECHVDPEDRFIRHCQCIDGWHGSDCTCQHSCSEEENHGYCHDGSCHCIEPFYGDQCRYGPSQMPPVIFILIFVWIVFIACCLCLFTLIVAFVVYMINNLAAKHERSQQETPASESETTHLFSRPPAQELTNVREGANNAETAQEEL